jgi:tRNA threonylcarbamoyl adenosine modification protein (Sua5/YciO/YrdC/YwlC family)
MKKHLPGAFTFVLNSNNKVPKMFKNRKRTIGVRIPGNNICQALVEGLDRPILTASLKSDDEILEYFTDPIDIYEDFGKLVDLVIDGGIGNNQPSTVVDCTGSEPVVLREGTGVLEL